MTEITKSIVNHMMKERGVSMRYIAINSKVDYTSISRWYRNELSLKSDAIAKLQTFIKEYHFVNSIEEIARLFKLDIKK